MHEFEACLMGPVRSVVVSCIMSFDLVDCKEQKSRNEKKIEAQ